MNEGEHLYELACEAVNLQAHIKALPDHELRLLRKHAQHIIQRNGKSGGIPALICGACVIDQADRFHSHK